MQKSQREIWNQEYGEEKHFESSKSFDPSQEVLELDRYFKDRGINPAGWTILDFACGNGRNSIYSLRQWNVGRAIGVDFSQIALSQFRQKVTEENLADKVDILEQSIDEKLPIEDESVNLALDVYGSINARENERTTCRDESFRVLKSGGLLLAYLTSADSGFVKGMMDLTQGPEEGSVIFGNGKFEKTFTEQEIREFYKMFEVVELRKHNFMVGKYPVEMFWLLLRKS